MFIHLMPRAIALEKKLVRYYTGKPCKYNHNSERYVKNCACVECITIKEKSRIDYKTDYRNKNKEREKENRAVFYEHNKEAIIERRRKSRLRGEAKGKKYV